MIKYVFTISQAMQYLSAMELREARGLKKEECAVLFFNKPYGTQIKQLKAVLNEDDWAVAKFIPFPDYWIPPGKGRSLSGRVMVLWSKLTSAGKFARKVNDFLENECAKPLELVATGNYLSRPHRHFLWAAEKRRGAKEIIILDEGTSVPNFIVPLRHNPHDREKLKRFKNRYSSRDIGGKFLRLSGLRHHHPANVTFFTVYKDILPPESDKVEVNKFGFLTAKAETFEEKDEVWFLGTCYVEFDYAYRDKYLALLKQAKEHFKGTKMLYFPHRYEADENLREIEKLGFEVTRSNMAIETLIVVRQERPKAFAAIATSAIDNISYMFGGKVPIQLFKPSRELFIEEQLINLCNDIIKGHLQNGRGAVTAIEVDFG